MTTPIHHDVYILADPEVAGALEIAFGRYQTTIYKSPRIPAFLALAKQAEGGTHTAALIDARFIQETELWAIVQQLTPVGLVIGVIGVQSIALRQQLASAGVMVLESTEADTIVDLIATAIGAANRSARSTVVIAIGGAKGGIGKSAVTARLAEGLAMRGAHVLLVDADMSNASMAAEFKAPPSVPPYLRIIEDKTNHAGFTPQALQSCLYRIRQPWGAIDLLVATDRMMPSASDLPLHGSHGWQGLLISLRRMHEVGEPYDVILIDTGPDIKRRPYPFWVAREGGWVIIPAPPGRHEREGLRTMLELMQQMPLPDQGKDISSRAMIVLVEPERGSYVSLDRFAPLIQQQWPHVPIIGSVPRSPGLISYLAEQPEYVSPLALYPAHAFSRSFHSIVDAVAALTGLRLPNPAPRTSWFDRMRARFQRIPASPHTPKPTMSSSTFA